MIVNCEVWQTKALCLWDLFFVDLAWYRYTIIFCIDLIIFVATKFFQRKKIYNTRLSLTVSKARLTGNSVKNCGRCALARYIGCGCNASRSVRQRKYRVIQMNLTDRLQSTKTPAHHVSLLFSMLFRGWWYYVLYVPRFI